MRDGRASATDPASIGSPEAAAFRALADALGADREALVAQATSIHRDGVALDRISAPTLILAGEDDPLAVRPEVLADAIPNAVLQTLAGNHIEALGDPRFTRSIVDFLAWPDDPPHPSRQSPEQPAAREAGLPGDVGAVRLHPT